jgi:hypothetical protein
MIVMIFFLGMLLGVLAGCAVCIRYLRQEMAANVGPGLRQIQLRLETLDAEINLALATRLAELSRLPARPQIPPNDQSSTS